MDDFTQFAFLPLCQLAPEMVLRKQGRWHGQHREVGRTSPSAVPMGCLELRAWVWDKADGVGVAVTKFAGVWPGAWSLHLDTGEVLH